MQILMVAQMCRSNNLISKFRENCLKFNVNYCINFIFVITEINPDKDFIANLND